MATWTRGALARQTGIHPETIRFYERSGLLHPARRSQSNYRLFDAAAAERILFIRRAQAAGFSLDDIRQLLAIRFDGDATCGDVRALVEGKLALVEARLRELHAMRDALAALRDDCPGGEHPLNECPILEQFSEPLPAAQPTIPEDTR